MMTALWPRPPPRTAEGDRSCARRISGSARPPRPRPPMRRKPRRVIPSQNRGPFPSSRSIYLLLRGRIGKGAPAWSKSAGDGDDPARDQVVAGLVVGPRLGLGEAVPVDGPDPQFVDPGLDSVQIHPPVHEAEPERPLLRPALIVEAPDVLRQRPVRKLILPVQREGLEDDRRPFRLAPRRIPQRQVLPRNPRGPQPIFDPFQAGPADHRHPPGPDGRALDGLV